MHATASGQLWGVIAVAALAAASGCASTRTVMARSDQMMRAEFRSSPPGQMAYVNQRPCGQTPLNVAAPYTHQIERVEFSGYRIGKALLITGGVGVGVGAAMTAGGFYLAGKDEASSGGGVALGTLGVMGIVYGLIGVTYGAIAMIGSPAPRDEESTTPMTMKLGIKGQDGVYHEVEVGPIESSSRRINFSEITSVTYDAGTGRWTLPGLVTLQAKPSK